MDRRTFKRVAVPALAAGLSLFGSVCQAAFAEGGTASPEQILVDNSVVNPFITLAAMPQGDDGILLSNLPQGDDKMLLAFGPPGPGMPPGPPGCPPGPGFPPGPPGFGGPGGPGGPGFPPPPGMGGPMSLPLHDVDLTDDQVEKLAAIRTSTREKADPIMLKVHSLEHEFISTLAQPAVNADDLGKLRTQISAQKQALDAIFADGAVASAQVLTPEQRKQIKNQMNRLELGPAAFKRKAPDAK